jgi:sterol 24-C-methyltransferase
MKVVYCMLVAVVAWQMYSWLDFSVYEATTAVRAVKDLMNLPEEDIEKCKAAWKFLQTNTSFNATETEVEVEHARALYSVLHHMLAMVSIEKMYIPPALDPKKGVFGNQLLAEEEVMKELKVDADSTILEIGCGRGKIAHHAARLTGGKVFGLNIDESQIKQARSYAEETGFSDRLQFTVSDAHKRFPYDDGTLDGVYTVQGLSLYTKVQEWGHVAGEIFRVLKPNASFSLMDYVLTRDFDRNNAEHMRLQKLWMPTLCAFHSSYDTEITDAFKRAGFEISLSAPSTAPSWPLSESKTMLFTMIRRIIARLNDIGLVGPWLLTLIDALMSGGEAYYAGEKSKIMDINWRIVARKPLGAIQKPLGVIQ